MDTYLSLSFLGALSERYRIEREAGSGGMATVYLAHELKHDRQVAIKVLRRELATPEGSERFLREVRIAAKLSHENILPLFDSGAVDELLYYVMPFVAEPTLKDRIQNEGALSVNEALRITREIANGLQYAHDQGVIHRDIKPANILLRRGHPLIADFGIAKAFAGAYAEDLTITQTGISLGTPAYMSPEQAFTQGVVDQRVDVYSLGCLLFELLTAQLPFTAANVHAVIAKHSSEPRPSVRAIRKAVPEHVDEAIRKAMAIDVSERFASCAEFAAALGEGLPSPSRFPRRAVVSAMAALAVAGMLYVGTQLPDVPRVRAAPSFADYPMPSAWVRRAGEAYSIIATSDSLLVVYRTRAAALHTFNGTKWTTLTVPDSFELRPYRGTLHNQRLLATRRGRDASGNETVQLWWLALSPHGLSPVEALTEPESPAPQPYWWSDGSTTVTWLETIRRKTSQGWVAEPTGAAGAVITMWGRDESHRHAVADSPRDSLLMNDGIGWERVDVLRDWSAGRPWYSGGTLLGDETSIVFGERCIDDARCVPLVLQERQAGSPWTPLRFSKGTGIPPVQQHRAEAGCVNRFDFLGASGRSADDYFIWGEWTFCREEGTRLEEDTGCPHGHPCVWHVVAGKVMPSTNLLGKVMLGTVVVRGTYHAMFDDGTVWTDTTGGWRPVGQLPEIPLRFVGASTKVVVMSIGRRIFYQHSGGARAKLVVSPLLGTPASVNDSMPPRRLQVRDTTMVLVTASGEVLVATCREGASRRSVTDDLRCSPWQALGGTPEPVLDADILPDGAIIAAGRRGFVGIWSGGVWRREQLPISVRGDSIWGLRVSLDGDVIAVGTNIVMTRNRQARWSIAGRPAIGFASGRNLVLNPGGGFAVGDGRVRVWERTDSSSMIELQRRIRGESQVSAIHGISDGRLIAGFENTNEPGVGGWLKVWAPPLRDNRWERVDLPMNVDVTDLADDGTLLYVVGRGGSMAIRLDSLPFASELRSTTGLAKTLRR